MSDQKLSLTAAIAVIRLQREGPIRHASLAAPEGTGQPSMAQLIQRMQREGLAMRISDPEDGRVALVDITDAGRALLDGRQRDRRHRLAQSPTTHPTMIRKATPRYQRRGAPNEGLLEPKQVTTNQPTTDGDG
jgi:DNA-binding MarR family transcriptional regulator